MCRQIAAAYDRPPDPHPPYSVDDLFTKLERATQIIEELEKRLTDTKAKVEELAPRIATVAGDE